MPSEFLTDKEQRKLQSMYEHFLNTLKSDVITMKLYTLGMLSEHEKTKYDVTPAYDKPSFLFHNVIMMSTYSQIKQIRRILFDEEHQLLAQMMCRRDDDFDDLDIRDWVRGQRSTQSSSSPMQSQSMDQTAYTPGPHTQHSPGPHTQHSPGPHTQHSPHTPQQPKTSQEESSPGSELSMPVSESLSLSAAKANKSQYRAQVPGKNQATAQQGGGGDQPTGSGQGYRLQKYYGVKRPSNKPCGNGMVVIFANFTDHLIGYRNDVEIIKEFFTTHLQYKADEQIHVYENLCEAEFVKALDEVQGWLRSKVPGEFTDRLFVFILSHGTEAGVKMCKPGSAFDEEIGSDGKSVCVPVNYIVDKFTHDASAVPYLKDFPKCFFIQTCQGEALAKAASDPCLQGRKVGEIDEWIVPSQQITIGADTLVFKASCPGTKSWVPDAGSWFIGHLIDVFEIYHRNEDMVSLLTETNHRISTEKCRGEGEKGQTVTGRQMSAFTSTLTKKLYLHLSE